MSSAHATGARVAGTPGGRAHRPRQGLRWLVVHRAEIMAVVALTAIVLGGALHAAAAGSTGELVWRAAVAVLAAELAGEVVRTIVVEHSLGVDTIALVAMVGSLVLGQELAGAVIGLMFSGGATLEALASARAKRELTALVQRAPKVAQLRTGDRLTEVPVEQVQIGDVVLVRTGEVIPVDGTIVSDEAVIDTSTLSGEPLPETITQGMPVLSGSANAGAPFAVRADRPAGESAYAALVRLVEQAHTQRAPLVRMADRYAGFFLPATLLVAGAAWALSGDAVRGLAVVVVATPCPLILAAPIALVAGLSRAARSGIIVKGATTIETLDAPARSCLTRPGHLRSARRRSATSSPTTAAAPTSCCGWQPVLTATPRTSSAWPSPARPRRRGSRSQPPPTLRSSPDRALRDRSTGIACSSAAGRSSVTTGSPRRRSPPLPPRVCAARVRRT